MMRIPASEHGIIRVFSLSLTKSELEQYLGADGRLTESGAQQLLGADAIDTRYVEAFPVADLGELGLAGYLLEGNDAQQSDVANDMVKLAALDGWVLLAYSAAFKGASQSLTPLPELTLIGTYHQTTTDQTFGTKIPSNAAKPYTGISADAVPLPHDSGLNNGVGVAVILAAIAIFLLIMFLF